MPQNSENVKEWNAVLKIALENTRGQNRKRLAAHQLINSLGNLVPLSQSINSSLSDNPYNVKRERYKEGSQSEIEISQIKSWDSKAIQKRTEKLLNFMFDRWDINKIILYWEQQGEYAENWVKGQKEAQKKLVFSIIERN